MRSRAVCIVAELPGSFRLLQERPFSTFWREGTMATTRPRERILDAATALADEGINATSVDRVIAEAVSPP